MFISILTNYYSRLLFCTLLFNVFVKKKKKRDSFVSFDLNLSLVISKFNDKHLYRLYDISEQKMDTKH